MRGRRTEGTTLVDLVVSCALFSVFMTVAIGLFTSMTRVVSREQKPAEQMMEARVAVLKVCRRIRNCKEMVSPTLREMMTGGDQSVIILRDRVLRRTVKFEVAKTPGQLQDKTQPDKYVFLHQCVSCNCNTDTDIQHATYLPEKRAPILPDQDVCS